MNVEALKEAIKRRRGKGLDLSILIAPEGMEGAESEEDELQDLAPDVKDEGAGMMAESEEEENPEHADEAQDKMLIAEMLDQYGKSPMREKMKAARK